MIEPRPIASLTSGLLARKGAARPAMRPQLPPLDAFPVAHFVQHDDLGWNDLGHDEPAMAEAQPLPEIVHQQEMLADRLATPVSADDNKAASTDAPASYARLTLGKRRSALSEGRRAAFTLRVDAERHLKLRLACTLRGLSAQQFVTEALDLLLERLPEVHSLATRVAGQR